MHPQIEGHTCGAWKDDLEKKAANSKAKLERYLHYYNHYKVMGRTIPRPRSRSAWSLRKHSATRQPQWFALSLAQGHLDSARKETKTVKLQALLPLLRERISGGVDWSYLLHANSVLLECRRVLSNAYVFAYFMFDADNWTAVR